MHGPQETRSIWVLVHKTRLGRTYVLGLVNYMCMITAVQVDAEQEFASQPRGGAMSAVAATFGTARRTFTLRLALANTNY